MTKTVNTDELIADYGPVAMAYCVNVLSAKLEAASQLLPDGLSLETQGILAEEVARSLDEFFRASDLTLFSFKRFCDTATSRAFVRL